jgi:Holliday junction resolvase
MDWKKQYSAAHQRFQRANYPSATKDFGCVPTSFPDVRKANGLTRAIINYLTWEGWRATRINSQGQLVKGAERQESGNILTVRQWRPGSTRKGTADISATINGRSCMFEVKTGRDKPSEYQLAEQARERKAGGIYEFIHTIEEFFQWYQMNVEIWK